MRFAHVGAVVESSSSHTGIDYVSFCTCGRFERVFGGSPAQPEGVLLLAFIDGEVGDGQGLDGISLVVHRGEVFQHRFIDRAGNGELERRVVPHLQVGEVLV